MLRNSLHLASLSRTASTELSPQESKPNSANAPVRPPRNVPITNDAWRAWIHQVATSANVSDLAAASTLGFCGECAVQSLEIIKSIVDTSFGYKPFSKPPAPTGSLFAVAFGNPIESFENEHKAEAEELKEYFEFVFDNLVKHKVTQSEMARFEITRGATIHLSDTIFPSYERKIISASGNYEKLYAAIQNNPLGSASLLGYRV